MRCTRRRNPTGCEFEEQFGYAYRVLKKQRSKKLVVRLCRNSILRPAAPEFATSIKTGRRPPPRRRGSGLDGREHAARRYQAGSASQASAWQRRVTGPPQFLLDYW